MCAISIFRNPVSPMMKRLAFRRIPTASILEVRTSRNSLKQIITVLVRKLISIACMLKIDVRAPLNWIMRP